jgi:hypothetical protein
MHALAHAVLSEYVELCGLYDLIESYSAKRNEDVYSTHPVLIDDQGRPLETLQGNMHIESFHLNGPHVLSKELQRIEDAVMQGLYSVRELHQLDMLASKILQGLLLLSESEDVPLSDDIVSLDEIKAGRLKQAGMLN